MNRFFRRRFLRLKFSFKLLIFILILKSNHIIEILIYHLSKIYISSTDILSNFYDNWFLH